MSDAIQIILQVIGAASTLYAFCFIGAAGVTTGIIFARSFWN